MSEGSSITEPILQKLQKRLPGRYDTFLRPDVLFDDIVLRGERDYDIHVVSMRKSLVSFSSHPRSWHTAMSSDSFQPFQFFERSHLSPSELNSIV